MSLLHTATVSWYHCCYLHPCIYEQWSLSQPQRPFENWGVHLERYIGDRMLLFSFHWKFHSWFHVLLSTLFCLVYWNLFCAFEISVLCDCLLQCCILSLESLNSILHTSQCFENIAPAKLIPTQLFFAPWLKNSNSLTHFPRSQSEPPSPGNPSEGMPPMLLLSSQTGWQNAGRVRACPGAGVPQDHPETGLRVRGAWPAGVRGRHLADALSAQGQPHTGWSEFHGLLSRRELIQWFLILHRHVYLLVLKNIWVVWWTLKAWIGHRGLEIACLVIVWFFCIPFANISTYSRKFLSSQPQCCRRITILNFCPWCCLIFTLW